MAHPTLFYTCFPANSDWQGLNVLGDITFVSFMALPRWPSKANALLSNVIKVVTTRSSVTTHFIVYDPTMALGSQHFLR